VGADCRLSVGWKIHASPLRRAKNVLRLSQPRVEVGSTQARERRGEGEGGWRPGAARIAEVWTVETMGNARTILDDKGRD